jgi:hypothetical protein
MTKSVKNGKSCQNRYRRSTSSIFPKQDKKRSTSSMNELGEMLKKQRPR